ncbi:hypothetical protein HDU76_011646 [Blyttiomyces sp. JEL0837]|nr:hypothetical protein HDU76_011646 [Blyttiomyces sp. JEL0837]
MATLLGFISVEMPKFSIVAKTPVYEIRRYQPHIRAEHVYQSDDEFGGQGFWPIANYIFGNNRVRPSSSSTTTATSTTKPNLEIAMTAPVLTETLPSQPSSTDSTTTKTSKEIAMTAPVLMETPSSSSSSTKKMSFKLPSEFKKISDLPLPNDSRINLVEVPEHVMAVITFSGRMTESLFKSKEKELREALLKDGVPVETDSLKTVRAGYNPPW